MPTSRPGHNEAIPAGSAEARIAIEPAPRSVGMAAPAAPLPLINLYLLYSEARKLRGPARALHCERGARARMIVRRIFATALVLVSLGLSPLAVSATPRAASLPQTAGPAAARVFANCTAMNKVYRHGVGRRGARDRVSGTSRPVTNFFVSTTIYLANTKSDRDKDGVACEKR